MGLAGDATGADRRSPDDPAHGLVGAAGWEALAVSIDLPQELTANLVRSPPPFPTPTDIQTDLRFKGLDSRLAGRIPCDCDPARELGVGDMEAGGKLIPRRALDACQREGTRQETAGC